MDYDPAAIDKLFLREISPEKRRKIIPLVTDITAPSPGHGWRSQESRPLLERIKSDFFMALALVHHLALAKNIPLEGVVDLLADIAPSGIVEWVSKEDKMVQFMLRNREDIFDSYNVDEFRNLLLGRFSIANEIILKGGVRTLFLVGPKQ